MKKFETKKFILFLVVVAVILTTSALVTIKRNQSIISDNYIKREKYCQDGVCIPDWVFSALPPIPKDFKQVQFMVENSLMPLENFTEGIPDEYYYKQPELYPAWKISGIQEYLILGKLKPGDKLPYPWIKGWAGFPGITIIRTKPEIERVAIVFLHAGWMICKFQGMGLEYFFPQEAPLPQQNIYVMQDPEVVRNYFEIQLEPTLVLLDATCPDFYETPAFRENWVQKVKLRIKVKEGTPQGDYAIFLQSVMPPEEIEQQWIRKYRTAYIGVGGVSIGQPIYQIFVRVQ